MLPATTTLDTAAVTASCDLPGAASQVVADSTQEVIVVTITALDYNYWSVMLCEVTSVV